VNAIDNSGIVYACGSGGMLYKSADTGNTWTRQFTGTANELTAMSFIDGEHGVAVGNRGTILWLKGGTVTDVSPLPPNRSPAGFVLNQNYPNPFNPSTTIHFVLPSSSNVTLQIFNVLGQQVALPLYQVWMAEGDHSVHFDAGELSSGVYFYRVSAEEVGSLNRVRQIQVRSGKMLLMR
jgi:hypothetical protein